MQPPWWPEGWLARLGGVPAVMGQLQPAVALRELGPDVTNVHGKPKVELFM